MKKNMFIVFLGLILMVGLSMVSCQKKETATKEKAATETTDYGEQAGEVVEKAKDTAAGYGEQAGEVVEKAEDKAGKALEGFGE